MSNEAPNPAKSADPPVEFAIKLDGIKCDELNLKFVVVDGQALIAVPDLISLLNRAVSVLSVPGLFASLLALKAEPADDQTIDAAPVEGSGRMRCEAEIKVALADISGRLDAIQGHVATWLTVDDGGPDGDTSYRLMLLLAFEQALKWALGLRQQPLSDYVTSDGACRDALLKRIKLPPA